jgi:hypothetical protein
VSCHGWQHDFLHLVCFTPRLTTLTFHPVCFAPAREQGELITWDTHRMSMRNAVRPLLGNSSMHYVASGPRLDTRGSKPWRDISNTTVFNGNMPMINEVHVSLSRLL